MDNAIKFTDRGEITLTAFVQDNDARFAVRDTGIGIDSANLKKHIRSILAGGTDQNTARGRHRSGLKLSRRLAQFLGGDLTIEGTMGEGAPLHCACHSRPAATRFDGWREQSGVLSPERFGPPTNSLTEP